MAVNESDQKAEATRRYYEHYDQYGKLFEPEHNGEYLAISPDGRTILGATLLEVMKKASAQFGPGNRLYKVGERAVFRWR